LLPCAAVAVFGEPMFALIFGDTWRTSGRIAETLVVGVFVYFVSYPTSNVLVVYERVKSFLVWQVAQLLIVGTALLSTLQLRRESLEWTVKMLVVGQVCIYLLSMALQWHAVSGETTRGNRLDRAGKSDDGHA
jgi:hypothetical protein